MKGLLIEACDLEKNYFDLKNSIQMTPLYERLLNRVERLKSKGFNKDNERVLSELKSLLRSKSFDLQKYFDLIINLKSYNEETIRHIESRSKWSWSISISDIQDIELRNNVIQLRFGVHGSYILEKYHHVIEGFRLAYFPFAVDYLENFNLPASLSSYNDLEDITSATTGRLETLRQSIRAINSNNRRIMKDLDSIHYTTPRDALYIWKYSDVRDEVRKLFEGKKIKLFADVKQSRNDYNGMKFKTVDIEFRSPNQSVNDQLNNALQSFHLEMTHTGISATRCEDDFYQIYTSPLSIETSFARDEKGFPYTRVATYDMMRSNKEPMQSPYTLWEVQILEKQNFDDNFRNISDLALFGSFDFDIELHGTGTYVDGNVPLPICSKKKLAKFYSQILD